MQRPTNQILPLLKLIPALFGAVIVVAPNCAAAQTTSGIPDASTQGIKHALFLTIKSDSNSPLLQQSAGESQTAALTVKIRISAHSQETNFYGDLPATVSDFDPIKGSSERKVWEDAKCHHARGIPKITVINVDGSIANKQKTLSIAARYRWLGLLLPGDEIMPGKRVAIGTDDIGPFFTMRTETKKSRLFVDLKLYTLPCDLQSVQTKRDVGDQTIEQLSGSTRDTTQSF
jgi:hypothetical protein